MQTDFHLLYPPDYDRNKAVPMKDYKFIHALKIDAMVILIKESYRGVADLSLENFFSTDERVLEYRLRSRRSGGKSITLRGILQGGIHYL